jgi:hypothetical protein
MSISFYFQVKKILLPCKKFRLLRGFQGAVKDPPGFGGRSTVIECSGVLGANTNSYLTTVALHFEPSIKLRAGTKGLAGQLESGIEVWVLGCFLHVEAGPVVGL